MSVEPSLQDEAARAGWLYYVAGMTQDQIATELGVSRQRAQRLVSRAMTEGLIHVRLNHQIGACLDLEAALTDRFHLTRCRVAPSLGAGVDPARAIAPAAAAELERVLRATEPLVIAFGTGRALRAMAEQFTFAEPVKHRIVSLLGNIAPDGSATLYDVISRIAEKLKATYYPMPVPVISDTPEEREFFMHLRPVRTVFNLARQADVTFVGVGQMGPDAPLALDGFVTPETLRELQAQGSVGEIGSWVFDADGRYIDSPRNALVGGVRVEPGQTQPVIAVAAGRAKVPAIRAALTGRIINGLVTDENTAAALLQAD
ncbi:MAG: DNA-binding transcriptional regulator [Rhodobacter sp.]|uniref:sugar-binding transcriptional regulator n=1 Tax=Tabrizicola sp. TaxID=2005166 RepID=UPI001D738DFA|nr:sugar-binding transcriptional regulator [Tabrizicola sp.]MBA3912047.1 DNA-binding transcriptional regulator [Rhodobacter sp.]MBY0349991.1 sugar-binding transcriptional regulator [Tabrizicola sp.]MDK2773442.1 sugar-binding transcriptional regulator [Tabrizicola sp.]